MRYKKTSKGSPKLTKCFITIIELSSEDIKGLNSSLEFKLFVQGNTAEVYAYDENKVFKLFKKNMPVELIVNEYDKARCIQSEI